MWDNITWSNIYVTEIEKDRREEEREIFKEIMLRTLKLMEDINPQI